MNGIANKSATNILFSLNVAYKCMYNKATLNKKKNVAMNTKDKKKKLKEKKQVQEMCLYCSKQCHCYPDCKG